MSKKIGLTLNEDIFKAICEFSRLNECSPTEFCRLIIEHQVEFYLSTKKVPIFKLSPKLFFKNSVDDSSEGDSKSTPYVPPFDPAHVEDVPDWDNLIAELDD